MGPSYSYDDVQDFKPYQAQNKGQRLNSGERQDREWYLRDFSQEDEQMVYLVYGRYSYLISSGSKIQNRCILNLFYLQRQEANTLREFNTQHHARTVSEGLILIE